jgi:hypothetical protein
MREGGRRRILIPPRYGWTGPDVQVSALGFLTLEAMLWDRFAAFFWHCLAVFLGIVLWTFWHCCFLALFHGLFLLLEHVKMPCEHETLSWLCFLSVHKPIPTTFGGQRRLAAHGDEPLLLEVELVRVQPSQRGDEVSCTESGPQ